MLLATLVLICLWPWLPTALAQDSHTHDSHQEAAVVKPRVFLDKSPRIVQYQLRRLSNAQLLLVDRATDDPKYLPVFTEIASRAGMSWEPREESLQGLAAIRQTSIIEELLTALEGLDRSDRNQELVFQQLTKMLLSQPLASLRSQLGQIRAATNVEGEAAKVAGFAALMYLGLHDEAWQLATDTAASGGKLAYLLAVERLPSPDSEEAVRRHVTDCLESALPSPIRRAAIRTLASIPSASAETFAALSPLVEVDGLRAAVTRTLLRLPQEEWPQTESAALLASLVAHIESIPASERTSVSELNGLQLADNLLARLPRSQARSYRERLRLVTVRVVQIDTVHEEMRYDKEYFAVEAGRPVQIVLRNDDAMPHNLVITAPQALRDVAQLAAQMGSELDANGNQYVPDSEQVLQATSMVQPGQHERLVFDAPAEPGEYPFVCTFPRHWMRMYGVMIVVPDLDDWLTDPKAPADPLGNTRPIVNHWSAGDFEDIAQGLRGRSPEIGQRLFTEATCAQCHKVRGTGGAVGPELTDVLKRWKGDHTAVLRELLDPSYKVEPKYAMHTIVTAEGQVLSGVVTQQDAKTLTLVTNPESPQPQVIQRSDIDDMIQSTTSMMPKGLLDRFSKDEIFELLAFITDQ